MVRAPLKCGLIILGALGLLGLSVTGIAQKVPNEPYPYQSYFKEAYQQYPSVPEGVLEALSYSNTRISNLNPDSFTSCSGIPPGWGVMGLIKNGKGHFRNTLPIVADHSAFSTEEIARQPRAAILGMAQAFARLQDTFNIQQSTVTENIPVIEFLSEIPGEQPGQQFAADLDLYSVLRVLNDPSLMGQWGYAAAQVDLEEVFGKKNLRVITADRVNLLRHKVEGDGTTYDPQQSSAQRQTCTNPPDYPPAIWDEADPSNYSDGRSCPISATTVHTIQGTYSGAISWFKDPAADVSSHYVLRSSDGQVTQMVCEIDKAWHVGTHNCYTIGFEHEGYVADGDQWYTDVMYQSSADITRNIIARRDTPRPFRTAYQPWAATDDADDGTYPTLGNCVRIKGHQHYSSNTHTDPGQYWDWDYYYKLINDPPPTTTFTSRSGTFYDSGGSGGNYGNDENHLYVINPPNVRDITINFNSFHLEADWDYLYVYDGTSQWDTLISYHHGSSVPGPITSSGGAIALEFRSDCATTESGWSISWSSTPQDSIPPTTDIAEGKDWQCCDFQTTFHDSDNKALQKRYYQVIQFDGNQWTANYRNGFFSDNFPGPSLRPVWETFSGDWKNRNYTLLQTNDSMFNTNIAAPLNQSLSNRYLYHWQMKIEGSGSIRRAGLHLFADSASQANRGNSYLIWVEGDYNEMRVYKSVNNTLSLEKAAPMNVNIGQWYDYKVTYDRISGQFYCYQDDQLILKWQDSNPIDTGQYISFRTGDSRSSFDNLKVYRSRYPSVTVRVGPDTTNDLRYENPDPPTFAGKVKSIVQDTAGNLSTIAQAPVHVDWTPPAFSGYPRDGTGSDIDTTTDGTVLHANWAEMDDRLSGTANYELAFGSAPRDSNVVNWQPYGLNTNGTESVSLTDDQIYYANIRATDTAGNVSRILSSDGQTYILYSGLSERDDSPKLQLSPNPTGGALRLQYRTDQPGPVHIQLLDMQGRVLEEQTFQAEKGPNHWGFSFLQSASPGSYLIRLRQGAHTSTYKVIKG